MPKRIGGEFRLPLSALRAVPISEPADTVAFSSARACIRLAVRIARKHNPDGYRFALPAFCCQAVVDAVRAEGVTPEFYRVPESLDVSPADLVPQLCLPGMLGALIVRYFGRRHSVDLTDWLDKCGWFTIDDCAHVSPWDTPPPQPRFGAQIFSPRKWAAVPDYAFARFALDTDHVAVRAALGRYARLRLFGLLLRNRWLLGAAERELDRNPILENPSNIGRRAYAAAVKKCFWLERYKNGGMLRGLLADIPHVQSLPVTPAGAPFTLPITTTHRDDLRAHLAAHKIYVPIHWRLPREVDPERFPEAARLSETILSLPLDQRYGLEDMQRMADVIGRFKA